MAFDSIRSDRDTAQLARTFTTAGAQVVLCDATPSPLAANPQAVNHLPAKIFYLAPAGGGSIIWLDANGTSNTLVIPAAGAACPAILTQLPSTARSIEAGSTNGFQVTATWNCAP